MQNRKNTGIMRKIAAAAAVLLLVTAVIAGFAPQRALASDTQGANVTDVMCPNLILGHNTATQYEFFIDDRADLFTDREEQELVPQMWKFTDTCNVCVLTVYENDYASTEDLLYYYYDEVFGYDDGVVFCIDMDERMVQMYSYGTPEDTLTKTKQQVISDNIYTYATNREYYLCALNGITQMYTVLSGGRISQPMKYISNVCIAAIFALLIAYAIARISSLSMEAGNKELLNSMFTRFGFRSTGSVLTGTSRTHVPRSSGSGSGSRGGGHRSGGGGHRGSSGGHRF